MVLPVILRRFMRVYKVSFIKDHKEIAYEFFKAINLDHAYELSNQIKQTNEYDTQIIIRFNPIWIHHEVYREDFSICQIKSKSISGYQIRQ